MSFVSIEFILFIAAVFLVYFLVPGRFRWIVLLVASYVFYWFSSRILILVLFGTTLLTFLFGLWLDKNRRRISEIPADMGREEKKAFKEAVKKRGNRITALGICLVLGILLFLKYYNFFGENLNALFGGIGLKLPAISLLLPLGISFYTLQAMAYLIDVNHGKVRADRNLPKFMLFLSFFPQIIQGPIARYNQLAAQLYEGHDFDYERFCFGLQLTLWGAMKKLILADRIAVPVAYLFEHYTEYHGPMVFLAALLYGIQLYADFSGGMDIIRGIAQVLGIDLAINFRQPYFSRSIEEFWRRWHITLGSWMRDYVFYPLSLSSAFSGLGKKSRKLFGSYVGNRLPAFLSMFIVYFLVGFWHGAEWKYIVYGIWNGMIIMSSLLLPNVYASMRKVLRIDENSWSWKGFQILRTVYLCSLGRFFSRAVDLRTSWEMIRASFDRWYDLSFLVNGSLTEIGLNTANWLLSLAAFCIILFVDSLHEKELCIRESIARQNILFRWLIYLLAVAALVVFGMYGPSINASNFIYEQF